MKIITFKQKKYFIWLCSSLLIIFTAIIYKTRADDFDIWFHLKYGEYFVNNLTWIIDPSIFSWTQSDKNWKYVTWIGSSILYLFYKLAKFPGLVALQWSIFLSIVGLYYAYIRKIGERFDIVNIANILLSRNSPKYYLNIYKTGNVYTLVLYDYAIYLF